MSLNLPRISRRLRRGLRTPTGPCASDPGPSPPAAVGPRATPPEGAPRGLGAQPGRRHGPHPKPGCRGSAVAWPGRDPAAAPVSTGPLGAVFLGDGRPALGPRPLPAPRAAPCPRPGLGRLGRIPRRFLHPARALIEKLGGLAYLFSWNAAGYIFMAFSQQCRVSVSNSAGEKKSRRRRRLRPACVCSPASADGN